MPVLDSSAILALLQKEKGQENVPLGGFISSVNFAEVVGKFEAKGENVSDLDVQLSILGFEIKPFTIEEAKETGRLLHLTKVKGLSLGDRACLAVARLLGEEAVTADRVWNEINIGVKVKLIR